jgi:hypothetical protein
MTSSTYSSGTYGSGTYGDFFSTPKRKIKGSGIRKIVSIKGNVKTYPKGEK